MKVHFLGDANRNIVLDTTSMMSGHHAWVWVVVGEFIL